MKNIITLAISFMVGFCLVTSAQATSQGNRHKNNKGKGHANHQGNGYGHHKNDKKKPKICKPKKVKKVKKVRNVKKVNKNSNTNSNVNRNTNTNSNVNKNTNNINNTVKNTVSNTVNASSKNTNTNEQKQGQLQGQLQGQNQKASSNQGQDQSANNEGINIADNSVVEDNSVYLAPPPTTPMVGTVSAQITTPFGGAGFSKDAKYSKLMTTIQFIEYMRDNDLLDDDKAKADALNVYHKLIKTVCGRNCISKTEKEPNVNYTISVPPQIIGE